MKNKITDLHLLFRNKEVLIGFYFLFFILGLSSNAHYYFYDEYRVFEITILLIFGLWAIYSQQLIFHKIEGLFFIFIAVGSLFWNNALFTVTDLLLTYLLYKSFYLLNYNALIAKVIVLSSLLLFLMLPVGLWDYINSGTYIANWYPLSWNIRVYNSYFLILSIFAVWFYSTTTKYKNIYLLFSFLAFFAVLLDGGRSVTLAYTLFIAIIAIFNSRIRLALVLTYAASWLAYIVTTYMANINTASLHIIRDTRQDRYQLWINAFQCWSQDPLLGCGFYQLGQYQHIAAHPHNLFIQVLTETGIIGFGFLAYIIFKIASNISWSLKQNYFVIAALLAISGDMSLSGVHIYPITQIALLWLFVFLLKNPEFTHAHHFNQKSAVVSRFQKLLPIIIYCLIAGWFIYIITQALNSSEGTPMTPPRFWLYGYLLY